MLCFTKLFATKNHLMEDAMTEKNSNQNFYSQNLLNLDTNSLSEDFKTNLQKLIKARRIKAFSPVARAAGGFLAIVAACVMSFTPYPKTLISHADGWLIYTLIAAVINLSALAAGLLKTEKPGKRLKKLNPAADALPAFIIGCVLTTALLLNWNFDSLFGVWLCCYGLMNFNLDAVLPENIRLVGFFYIFCGTLILLLPAVLYILGFYNYVIPGINSISGNPENKFFTNPWLLAIPLFIGETWAAAIFHQNKN